MVSITNKSMYLFDLYFINMTFYAGQDKSGWTLVSVVEEVFPHHPSIVRASVMGNERDTLMSHRPFYKLTKACERLLIVTI